MSEGRIRKRYYNPYSLSSQITLGWNRTYYQGRLLANNPVKVAAPSHYDRETTFDQCHPGPPYRSGGPFGTVKSHYGRYEQHNTGTYYQSYSALIAYEYVGSFIVQDKAPGTSMAASMASSGESGLYSLDVCDPSSYGASAWKRFKPAKPTADLGVFVGEIHDVPRMLQTTAKGFHNLWRSMGGSRTDFGPKRVADHWLNTQFGWLPFLSDMRKFVKAYTDSETIYNRLRRDNGQWVKRGGTIVDRVEDLANPTSSETVTAHAPPMVSCFYLDTQKQGAYVGTSTKQERAWFEARFRYYMPMLESVNGMEDLRFKLWNWGANISPSLLWELTPWSWLIDYFSNVGDVLSNMDSALTSNLVAKYAYVMRTVELVRHVDSLLRLKQATLVASADVERVVYKGRGGANPYGFGLTFDDLSERQWSILSALGFSRSRLSW